jgi:hypothetical protein
LATVLDQVLRELSGHELIEVGFCRFFVSAHPDEKLIQVLQRRIHVLCFGRECFVLDSRVSAGKRTYTRSVPQMAAVKLIEQLRPSPGGTENRAA